MERICILCKQIVRTDKQRTAQNRNSACSVFFGQRIQFAEQQFIEELVHKNELRKNKKQHKEHEYFEKQNDKTAEDSVDKVVCCHIDERMHDEPDNPKNECAAGGRKKAQQSRRLCTRFCFVYDGNEQKN